MRVLRRDVFVGGEWDEWIVDGEYDDFVGCQRDARVYVECECGGGGGRRGRNVDGDGDSGEWINGVVTLAGVGWPAGLRGCLERVR